MALEKEYRRPVPVSSGPVSVAVAISGYEGVSRSRTCSMLIWGFGSGIRDPLKANSRGKVLDLSVEIAIFFSPKSGWDGDWVIVTMIRSSITAVALAHEVQGISARPRSALGEAPKIRE